MSRVTAVAILAATVVQGYSEPTGCDFFGLTMSTGEWGLFADEVNCLCQDGEFVDCTVPILPGRTPLKCDLGLYNHMEWSACNAGECDRKQCWNGAWIKPYYDCPLPTGGLLPHGSAGTFGDQHCRCVGFAKETALESCVSIAQLAYAVHDPIALRSQLVSKDFRTRVEQRNFNANENSADLRNTSESNVLQANDNSNALGYVGNGMAASFVQIPACTSVAPHLHPRASELLTVIEGSILTQFSSENGGQIFRDHLQADEATLIPSGLPHYQVNIGCKTARYLSVLNHERPGMLTLTDTETVVEYKKDQGSSDRSPAQNILQLEEQCFLDCKIAVPVKPKADPVVKPAAAAVATDKAPMVEPVDVVSVTEMQSRRPRGPDGDRIRKPRRPDGDRTRKPRAQR